MAGAGPIPIIVGSQPTDLTISAAVLFIKLLDNCSRTYCSVTDYTSQGLQVVFLDGVFCSNDHGSGAVTDPLSNE